MNLFLSLGSDCFRSAPRGEEVGFAHLLIGAAAHIVFFAAVELRNCLCRSLIAHGYGIYIGELRRGAAPKPISGGSRLISLKTPAKQYSHLKAQE